MRRRPVADRSAAPVVVRVRFGSSGVVAEWSPVPPPLGWDLSSSRAAAEHWADEHAGAMGLRRGPLASAAWRSLAKAVDAATGDGLDRRSLIRADLMTRGRRD